MVCICRSYDNFIMEQLKCIAEYQRLKMKPSSESDILTSRFNHVLKGYPETFPEFVSSLKVAASTVPPHGPINL